MKAVSPLVSTILVIAIIVVIGGMLGSWAPNFVGRKVNNTQTDTENRITCQNTAYDFDTSYGNSGTEWDFSGTNDYLRVKIINTGSVNLHSFSFQIYIQGAGYQFFPVKNEITPDNPLKPTQSTIIEANIAGDLVGSLTEVRILNGVCKTFSLAQEF